MSQNMTQQLDQNVINAIINILDQQIVTNPQYLNRLRESAESAKLAEAVGDNQLIDTHWRIEEFEYFQPDLVVNDRNSLDNVVIIEYDMTYRNVDAFCERIKDAIALRGNEIVRDNLHLCFHDSANR